MLGGKLSQWGHLSGSSEMASTELAVGRSYGVRTPNCYKDSGKEGKEVRKGSKNLRGRCSQDIIRNLDEEPR
jgi:hypothetical protein